ncbi:MAG: immune inhibitor A [Thermoflexales bacterium]|nr:immune inhibitor A [Thermoflexales bacterium]
MNNTRNVWIALLIGLVLICACFGIVGAGLTWLVVRTVTSDAFRNFPPDIDPLPDALGVTATPTLVEVMRPTPQTMAGLPDDPIEIITAATLPREDLAELAMRFKGVSPKQAEVSCPTLAPGYEVGATRMFTLTNADTDEMFQIEARLEQKGDHVYMWVQSAPTPVSLDQDKLRRAVEIFDRQIYPRTRAFFGSEDVPGVDCDPRVHVVHAVGLGQTIGGYFSSPDSYPRAVRSDSNEGQVFIMHAARGYNGSDPGSQAYLSTLAHEFQHMISFNQAHTPELWLEEGAAQFAERLNGYGEFVSTVYDFAAAPETQLNTWQEDNAGGNSAHYGAGYLFWSYLYDRFGEEVLRKFARAPERSVRGLLRVLADNGVVDPDTGRALTFEGLFADFVIANYMNREAIEPGTNRYNYATIRVPPMATRAALDAGDYPYSTRAGLAQFGTHYYRLEGNRPVTVAFVGSTVVSLLPTDEADGAFWWSNRADASNSRLTRAVNLTGVSSATLTYRAWYRLEKNYDYAYVTASADGGLTWKVLLPTSCTTDNPQNANLGCGYTGSSGGDAPRWLNERVSLDKFAGREILLRFEMVTDAAINREGLAIDDIAIPEIGFFDDASTSSGWQAEGWVRIGNVLPQRWQVQVIITDRDGKLRLQRMALADAIGELTLDFGETVRSAVLAISPTTQGTTEAAGYELRIR